MKKLLPQPISASAPDNPDVDLYEDNAGNLYLVAHSRVWSGFELLDPGSGLTLLLDAAANLTDDWRMAWEPITDYSVDGNFDPPGEIVASYHRDGAIEILPFACGKAARRLLGLPTEGIE